MDITYREARPEDLPECVHLFTESVTDLRMRHNIPSPPQPSAAVRLAAYQHIYSTGFFHVALDGERIVAFACALLRDRLWFLAGFWARPAVQQQHIGMGLLSRIMDAGKQAGATTYFVWSSSDLPAMAAYFKSRMLPGTQILVFEGAPKVTRIAPAAYTTEPLTSAVAVSLDRVMLGAPREQDHDFFARIGWRGTQVMRNGAGIGYYYLHDGVVGPAAWMHPRHADPVLALACGGQPHISMMVPGTNHDAIDFALASGLRLTGFAHLFTSSRFGHLDRYLPSGPALF